MIDLETTLNVGCGELVALSATPEFVVEAITNIRRYEFLFVSGDHSHVLPSFNRMATDFDVRRAFTVYQLKQILEESHHTILFIESNTLEINEFVERLLMGLKEITGNNSTIIIYSPKLDKLFWFTAKHADRIITVKKLSKGYMVWEGGEEVFIPLHKNRSLGDFCG